MTARTHLVPDSVRGSRARARIGRSLGIGVLTGSAAAPFVVLALWSFASQWFYPSLTPTAWTTDSWTALLRGGPLGRATLSSVGLGATVAIAGCAIALPIGRALARARGPLRHVALAAVLLPAAAPPIAVATGLQLSFIMMGLAGRFVGVGLAHLVPAVGVLSFFFFAVFTAYDVRVEEEARSLGATPRQVWLRITLPLLRPALLAGAALGFIMSWGQVPLTLIIGGGTVHTLPLDVMAYAAAGEQRTAAAGALLLIVPPVIVLLLARRRSGARPEGTGA
jgi:putative spermidine/putrescine transport system permease protein